MPDFTICAVRKKRLKYLQKLLHQKCHGCFHPDTAKLLLIERKPLSFLVFVNKGIPDLALFERGKHLLRTFPVRNKAIGLLCLLWRGSTPLKAAEHALKFQTFYQFVCRLVKHIADFQDLLIPF